MGYTNYWHQHIDFNDKQWKALQQEAEYIDGIASGNLADIEITDDYILMNGNPGCETFVLNKNRPTEKDYESQDLSFNFCKTRAMTYDIYIWHMLIFAAGMINDVEKFSISRDL
jgi:hypothetical protein|tara:strand:- start:340 stop:681 length:342 start_codon:yes stop_codon:yes gene_type:complete